MNFTARQLEIFVAAAAEGSFARAGDAFGISQAAVSNHIRLLEKDFGRPLFDRRTGTTPTLTTSGVELFTETKRFLEVTRELAVVSQKPAKPIRIYAGSHLLDHFIRPALPGFLAQFPDVRLQFLSERSHDKVAEGLNSGSIDFAIVISPQSAVFPNTQVLTKVRSGLYAASGYEGPVTPTGLGQQRMILPHEDSPDRAIVQRHLLERGVKTSGEIVRTQYPAVMVQLVADGVGIAPLLASMASKEASHGSIRRVLDLPEWFVCLARSSNRSRSDNNVTDVFFGTIAKEIEFISNES